MISDLRILRDFRNYFIELKTYGVTSYELNLLQKLFSSYTITNSGSYFGNIQLNEHENARQLNTLMFELIRELTDTSHPEYREKIIKLHKELFGVI